MPLRDGRRQHECDVLAVDTPLEDMRTVGITKLVQAPEAAVYIPQQEHAMAPKKNYRPAIVWKVNMETKLALIVKIRTNVGPKFDRRIRELPTLEVPVMT